MVGCHHWLNGHEFEQASGVGDGQGSLACCSSWGRKELDTTKQLNWVQLPDNYWDFVLPVPRDALTAVILWVLYAVTSPAQWPKYRLLCEVLLLKDLRFQATWGLCEMSPKYDYCCCVGPWKRFLQKAVSLQSPTNSPKRQHINLHLILVDSLFPWRLFSVTMPWPRLNLPPHCNKHCYLQSPTMGMLPASVTAPHTSPQEACYPPYRWRNSATQGDNRNTLSVPTACFFFNKHLVKSYCMQSTCGSFW